MLNCVLADVCLSDYWGGHHLPHVQIPVYKGMTLKEIKEAIRQAIRWGEVMGSCDAAYLLAAEWVGPDNEKAAERITRQAYAAINRIKPAKKGQRKFFLDLEEQGEDDCSESVYAFFVFVEA